MKIRFKMQFKMVENIERSCIDCMYEKYRQHNDPVERQLLLSIERSGIHTPLAGIIGNDCPEQFILLDGFKRYRCAKKLGIDQLPVTSVSSNVVGGLFHIIRSQNASALTVLEQASFIHELQNRHGLALSEIARRVERSVAWVSKRITLITHMDEEIRQKILSGAFPLRSYMYTLAPFTRVKKKKDSVLPFIRSTSGHQFSTRDIEVLARGFFGDNPEVKKQILEGNVDWTLRMLKDDTNTPPGPKSPREYLSHELRSCYWHTREFIKLWNATAHHHEVFGLHKLSETLELLIKNCITIQHFSIERTGHDTAGREEDYSCTV